jgi:alpha-amylase
MLNEDVQLQIFEWYTEGGGNHWKAITELAPKLADFGITAMWIPRTF